ncbi:hypothetical protein V8C37DRAFT_415184 [Trichoderma ceciliae]
MASNGLASTSSLSPVPTRVSSKEPPTSDELWVLACHSICAAEGLPSLGTCEVTRWDPGFEPSIAPLADLERRLTCKRTSMLDMAEVRTSSCIWATYVTLHGETYVSALSNKRTDEVVYDPGPKSTADVVYVARGPLGVKKVGLKLRNLQRAQDGDLQLPLWSAPFFRRDLVRFPPSPSLKPVKFDHIMINDPETTGYSVSCYANVSEDSAAWLHVPVGRGEFLKELWRRDYSVDHRQKVDLLLVTTTGRVHVLGKHPTPGHTYSDSRVATFRNEPDYMYLYIEGSSGVRELALNPAPNAHETSQNLRLPVPKSRYPKLTSVESYFFTSAPLETLGSIKLCSSNGIVTGLLLHYHDGSRASVGQVRLDRLTEERQLSPANLDSDLEVPCHGTLEWWFSRRQCQLAHEWRTSASTRG